jgi:hypothetical protein
MKYLISFLLAILAGYILTGCSSLTDTPDSTGFRLNPNNGIFLPAENCENNRMIFGVYTLEFNPQSMQASMEPARSVESHLNVSNYLYPPQCADCVQYNILGYDPVAKILDVDITLKNPLTATGFDVRGIVYSSNTILFPLVNADSWTNLYDIPGGMSYNLNPFKAFNRGRASRDFPALSISTENFKIYFPGLYSVNIAFDASWPSNCQEPYEIRKFRQESPFVTSGRVSVDVLDWQNDITRVEVFCPQINGALINLSHATGTTWTGTIDNTTAAGQGLYNILIVASSPGGNLFNLSKLEVIPAQPPHQISKVGQSNGASLSCNSLAFDDKFIFVNCIASYEWILKKYDKNTLTLLNAVWGNGACYDMAVNDQYLFVTGVMGLVVYSKDLAEIGYGNNGGDMIDMYADFPNGVIYTSVDTVSQGLYIWDLSDPLNPTTMNPSLGFDSNGIDVQGDYVYANDILGGLHIINRWDGVEQGSVYWTPGSLGDVVVQYGHAYIMDNGYGPVVTVDVTNPGNPVVCNEMTSAVYPSDAAIDRGWVFALGASGLKVMNALTPCSETFEIPVYQVGNKIVFEGDIAYLTLGPSADFYKMQVVW